MGYATPTPAIHANNGNALQLIYTAPTNKQVVLGSVIAANTGAMPNAACTASLFRRRAGVDYYFSQGKSVATATSENLLPKATTLQAGDLLYGLVPPGSTPAMSCWQPVQVLQNTGVGSIYGLLANLTGTTIIAFCTSGIYRSTDQGVNWTQVSTQTFAAEKPHVTINVGGVTPTMFWYSANNNAYKSTDDGQTWSLVNAVTNAPEFMVDSLGSVVKGTAGTTYGGLNLAGLQLTTSTDGTTWTLATAFTNACASLCYSGTNWVAGRGGTACDINYSVNGAAWTVVAAITAGTPNGRNNLSSNGAGVVMFANNAVLMRSADNGVTWTLTATVTTMAGAGGTGIGHLFTGSVFAIQGSGSNPDVISKANTGLASNWAAGFGSNLYVRGDICCISNTYVFSTLASGVSAKFHRSSDLLMSQNLGMDITASIVEQQ